MMPARDPVSSEMADLKNDVAGLKADHAAAVAGLKADMARVEAEVRVTKHDVVNLKDMFNGLNVRFDKLEDKIVGKIDSLADKLAGVNLTQARGIGFFAGMSAVITIAGGFLLALGKLLFGVHQ